MDKKLVSNICYGGSAVISGLLCIGNASMILIDANPSWITNSILFIFLFYFTANKVTK